MSRTPSPAYFISAKGTPVIYADFGDSFRKLVILSGGGSRLACLTPDS